MHRKRITVLLAICMLFSVFTGMTPSYVVRAMQPTLAINIDADQEDWQSLLASGKAKKVGDGTSYEFEGCATTTSALYLANDDEYLYYFVDAEVPNWGKDGMYIDLALYVESQESGLSSNPWGHQYTYEMSNLPQYHIINKVEGESGSYNELYSVKNGAFNRANGSSYEGAADIASGYEGKVKLSELNVKNGDFIHSIVTLSGNNSGEHGAFNAIPTNNELATQWNHNGNPNGQSDYADSFLVTMSETMPDEVPEYISPEVVGNQVTFRYYQENPIASVRVAGDFNGWGDRKDELIQNKDGVWETTLTLEDGKHAYKFIVGDNTWVTDPKNEKIQDGNSVVMVGPESPLEYISPEVDGNKVTFRYKKEAPVDRVRVAGSFNGWENSKDELTQNADGIWETTLELVGGKHQYKFIVGKDEWITDPANDVQSDGNSVVIVSGIAAEPTTALLKGEKVVLKRIGNVYDLEGNLHENIALTYEKVGDGPEVITQEGNLQTLSVPTDYKGEIVTLKVSAMIQDTTYEAFVNFKVVDELYTYTINYYRPTADYANWNVWLWEDGGAGYEERFEKEVAFELGDDKSYSFQQGVYEMSADHMNFILRKGEWEEKDTSIDRVIQVPEGQDHVEVWMIQGDEKVYYDKGVIDLSAKVSNAFADTNQELIVAVSTPLNATTEFYLEDDKGNKIPTKTEKMNDLLYTVSITDHTSIDPTRSYTMGASNYQSTTVKMRKILDAYYYDGDDLGVSYTENGSSFKVWAPTATDVDLMLYTDAGQYNELGKVTDHTNGKPYDMSRTADGVWQATVTQNLDDYYYMYKVTFADGTLNYAVDPYARSTSANGQRGAIIDLDSTDPVGWEDDVKPVMISETDAVLYELHVRDMSMDPAVNFENKGKYKAFTEEGIITPGGNTAGIDHLNELGVTHLHLLPVYDFATVDETKVDDPGYQGKTFNWGYDPQNYNVPEGSYATDPSNPKARVTEFKEMVAAIHNNDMRVVMDVVYNHTYNTQSSSFEQIVPGYYYRTHDHGEYSNGSGCGNEVASERPMVSKFIEDSTTYWATEYNVDGFRFDLMGLIDTPTMISVSNTLKEEVDPSILVYGEPWQAGGSVLSGDKQTLKGSQKGEEFAVFNDEIRGAIKGGSDDGSKGFVSGAVDKEKDILKGVEGTINGFAQEPTEVINYVTAHDNLNLWDKMIKTQGLDESEGFIKIKDGELIAGGSVADAVDAATPHSQVDPNNVMENDTVKMSILANGIALTSQGIPFMHAGDELLRTKYGDHNSYKSPDAVNMIRWEQKDEFEEVFNYYTGLIELRKQHPAFKMDEASEIRKHFKVLKQDENVVSFMLKDYANGDRWKNIVVIYNASTKKQTLTLPHQADWHVVVDGKQAGTTAIRTLKGNTTVEVAPISMMVIYDESNEYEAIPTTITVDKKMIGMEVGSSQTLKAVVKDQYGVAMPNATVTWEVADHQVVEINKGKMIAKQMGKTTVKAVCGDISQTITVEVVEKLVPTKLTITPSKDFIYQGLSIVLKTQVYDQFEQLMPKAEVTWKSETPEFAKVNRMGEVTGLQEGIARITGTAGDVAQTIELEVRAYQNRYVVIEYHRPDGDYTDWNVWVWNTGVKNDPIDFVIEEDKAVAYVEVGPDTQSIGFIVRKGDWDDKDVDSDRFIDIPVGEVITKVKLESKQMAFQTLEKGSMPTINPQEEKIIFTYRDQELYKNGQMDTLQKVQVEINDVLYDMTYNACQERYEYTYTELAEGKYLYSYHVTNQAGQTVEQLDSYNKNKENNKSVLAYQKLDFTIAAEAMPSAVSYNENSVVKVDIQGPIEEIAKILIDLNSVGGTRIEVDKDLMEVTIGISDTVTVGMKQLPIEVIDTMNNHYKSSVQIEVVPRLSEKDFDWDEAVVYFMLTDRFKNANTSNDDPYGIGYDKNDPGTYHGGDFAGVTEQLDYLDALGVNTIWISPVVENIAYDVRFKDTPYENAYYAYHGYWAKDFERLNPHFGTVEEFHTLIDEAHDREMKIMVDVVINHAGYGMDKGMENEPPNYPTDADRSKFEGMIRENESSDEVLGQLAGLPDFKTEDPEVRDQMVDWQVAWVERIGKTAKGNTIDYFRVDTVKHVEDDTWMALKNELTKVKPEFKLIGEAWGASATNDLGYLNSGMMDSVLDFTFKEIAMQFVKGDIEQAYDRLEERHDAISNTAAVGNFLSSHDEDGFLYKLNGNEDAFKVAVTLQAMSKGQPIIYYGEELGYSGANNYPKYDNRPDIDWTKVDASNDLLAHYQKVFGIRETYSKILSKGDMDKLGGSDAVGYLATSRSYENKSMVITLNTKEQVSVTLQVPFKVGTKLKDEYTGLEYVVGAEQMVTYTVPAAKDGGTSILVAIEDDNNNGGNGNSGSDNNSSNNTSKDQFDEWLKKQEVNENNQLIIKGDKTKDQAGVTIQLDTLRKVSEKADEIVVNLEGVLITIPVSMINADLGDTKQIMITQKIVDATEHTEIAKGMLVSSIYDLTITLVDRAGKKTNVTSFDEAIQIQILLEQEQLDKVHDLRKVGMYYIADDGTYIYCGGSVEDGKLIFATNHLSKYVAMEYIKTFDDVSEDHWANEFVEVLASRHLIKGRDENKYEPKGNVTQAEMVVLLSRALGMDETTNPNNDGNNETTTWYSEAVSTIKEQAMLPPTIEEVFEPNKPMTREETAYLFARAYEYTMDIASEDIEAQNEKVFIDHSKISEWAVEPVYTCQDLGIINGKSNQEFAPKDDVTRAEVAAMLMRFLEQTNQINNKN